MGDRAGAASRAMVGGATAHLIERIAGGDDAALGGLVGSETPAMRRTALRIVRRTDLAEDAVQDALVQVWRRAGQFDARRGSAQGWLHAVVRNAALEMLRRNRRHVAFDQGVLMALIDRRQPLPSAQDPAVDRMAVRDELMRLDPSRRRSVFLVHVLGLTQAEAAREMGVPLGTCKSWVRRGLLELRGQLATARPEALARHRDRTAA